MFKLNSVSREKTILSSGLVDGNHVFYIIVDNTDIREFHTFDVDVSYTVDDLNLRATKFEVKRYDITAVTDDADPSSQGAAYVNMTQNTKFP